MDEAELVAAARDGDREAFEELVRAGIADTYTLARRLTGDEEDAKDVVQEAYVRAWRGIGSFRGEAAWSTWMYRITANAAATVAKRRRRQRAELVEEEPAVPSPEAGPEARAESADALDRLARAVDELPATLRSVVVLKDVYGLSHDEVAEALGISVGAAKVRLHRARRRLRDVVPREEERARAV